MPRVFTHFLKSALILKMCLLKPNVFKWRFLDLVSFIKLAWNIRFYVANLISTFRLKDRVVIYICNFQPFHSLSNPFIQWIRLAVPKKLIYSFLSITYLRNCLPPQEEGCRLPPPHPPVTVPSRYEPYFKRTTHKLWI